MSQQKMQCGGVHSLRTRVTAGLVAGVTAFAGLGISAQAAPAREAKAPVGASQIAAPHIKTVTGYMSSTDQWHTKIFTKKDLVAHPKGSIVVIPGAGEHQGRYDYVAKRFAEAGYNVFRLDHRGHGMSAAPYVNNVVPRGHIDDWNSILADIHQLVGIAKKDTPGKKTFLLGHSMGAQAVQGYGIAYPNDVDGIISTAGGIAMNLYGKDTLKPEEITAKNLTEAEKNAKPTVSQLLPLDQLTSIRNSLMPQYKKDPKNFRLTSSPFSASARTKIPNTLVIFPKSAFNGVNTDPRSYESFANDPLNDRYMTAGLLTQMAVGQLYTTFNARDFTTPTLIMHGEADGLAPSFADVNWYNAISSKDKTAIFWKGLMHEILNETVRDQVIDKTLDWINARNK